MQINYDKRKIETALGHFTKATGINVQFLKSDFSSLGVVYSANGYCECVHSSEKGRNGCIKSDEELLMRCKASRKPETHVCHAGLVDVAVPIILDGDIAGYLILGQMKENKPFGDLEKYLKDLSLDTEMMAERYEALTTFDPLRIESIVSISEMLAKYLLLENSLKPQFGFSVQTAVDYITENLAEPLSVENIARKCGVSKNTLYRSFADETGMTVGEYITQKRVEKAENLLISTDMSVEQIANETGFATAAYFGALFKKLNGISPLKFRKERQQSEV